MNRDSTRDSNTRDSHTQNGPRDLVYDRFQPGDAEAFARLMRQGFGMPAEQTARYRRAQGDSRFRVLRRRGAGRTGVPVAGAGLFAMDQYFGGRPVPCLEVAVVAVEPAERGRGLGGALMREILAEARAVGCAVSALYTATFPLYAGLGYARAGVRVRYRAPLAAWARLRAWAPGPRPLVRMLPVDPAALSALKREQARRGNGLLDRSPVQWEFVLKPGGDGDADVFLIRDGPDDDGEVAGFLALDPPRNRRLPVRDLCLLGADAARDAMAFLAGYAPLVDTVTWYGGPEDPLVHLAPEVGAAVDDWEEWALRIVDVERALARRGYPEGLAAELVLEVDDPVLAANRGRFRLTVADGEGRVERLPAGGGAPVLRLPVAALAPLYSGHLTPSALRAMGRVEGPDAALAVATLIFAGPRPWLADFF